MNKYVSVAKAGDIIRCINGHDLFRVLVDIIPGAVIESKNFSPIGDTPAPQAGKPIEPCHICGTPWITKGIGNGYVFCNVRTKL
jgi:hypothetical protein